MAGLEEVRSVSKFGLSQVVAIFTDDTDVYFARQQINERLAEVQLARRESPGPRWGRWRPASGEVYHYLITSQVYDLTELRTLQDWVIRPRLRRVPGVAEINSWGGFEKQYEVRADPAKLAKYGLTFDDLAGALRENNEDFGGGYVAGAGEAVLVQGISRPHTVDQIGEITIEAHEGVPIKVRDVAEVAVGHVIRRGGVTANGRGEAVLGLGFMRMGENSREVTRALDAALRDIRKALPDGVRIDVTYERTELVDQVLQTVERNLVEGAILVIAVLFAFLGNLRAGLIVAAAIPLSMLFAVTMMQKVGIAGSLMSLGAIDFGLIVDSSVVMVENCVRRLAHDRSGRGKLAIIRDAALEVRKPTMFGELIIMIVYLPILTLQGVEGKLFRPMALTVIFALAASMILSLTLMPVLASLGLPRTLREKETLVDRLAHRLFGPFLHLGLRFPRSTLVLIAAITVATTILGLGLGSEFVPKLGEGTIVINTVRLAGVSLEESLSAGTRVERMLLEEFPDEIDAIWSRTGTAEVATDPMGLEMTDVFISLKPRSRWKRAQTQEELMEAMSEVTETLPGMRAVYGQPIEERINEMVAGIKADLGIKLFGPDLDLLRRKAGELVAVVSRIPGAADVGAEQLTGQPVLRVEIDRQALSRYGVSSRQVLESIEAAGGLVVGEVLEPGRRFPLAVRLPQSYRDDPRAIGRILIPTATGARLPLTLLAHLIREEGPATINREWGERRIVVQANVRGRDLGSFVAEAQRRVGRERHPADRLPHRVGRAVREPDPSRTAADARRAAGPGPDPELALPDFPLVPGCLDDLQRRPLRAGRRRGRPVRDGFAVHDLGGCRLRGPGRRFDAGGPRPGQRDPRPDGPRPAEARGDRVGPAGPIATRPDDRHGGGPGVRADDALDRHRRRGPATPGDRRRLRHGLRHFPDHARPAGPLPALRQRAPGRGRPGEPRASRRRPSVLRSPSGRPDRGGPVRAGRTVVTRPPRPLPTPGERPRIPGSSRRFRRKGGRFTRSAARSARGSSARPRARPPASSSPSSDGLLRDRRATLPSRRHDHRRTDPPAIPDLEDLRYISCPPAKPRASFLGLAL